MKSEAIDTADENRPSPVEGVDTASLPPAQQPWGHLEEASWHTALYHSMSRMAQPGLMACGPSR